MTFKEHARLHQIWFRENVLKLPAGKYGAWLNEKDGKEGYNFYSGFPEILNVANTKISFSENLHCDMLRSEHIPFICTTNR